MEQRGPVALFECLQRIPCNPCADACPRGAITVKELNDCPVVDETKCNGCGICMTHCPGLSIFVVDHNYRPGESLVKIPYEFLPLPTAGQLVDAVNRQGGVIGTAKVERVQKSPNQTHIVWLTVPRELAAETRHFRLRKEQDHEC